MKISVYLKITQITAFNHLTVAVWEIYHINVHRMVSVLGILLSVRVRKCAQPDTTCVQIILACLDLHNSLYVINCQPALILLTKEQGVQMVSHV